MKDSFVLYTSYKDKFKSLSYEQKGMLLDAIFEYEMTDVKPEIEDGMVLIAFDFIKYDLDENNKKYQKKVENLAKNKANQKSDRNQSEISMKSDRNQSEIESVNVNDNDNVHVNENVKVSEKESIKEKSDSTNVSSDTRPVKHKYGEYQHVLLTDTDRERLVNDYGENSVHDAIKYLDEYIETYGKKYKNHYLVMRKWVFDAVKEHKARGEPKSILQEWADA